MGDQSQLVSPWVLRLSALVGGYGVLSLPFESALHTVCMVLVAFPLGYWLARLMNDAEKWRRHVGGHRHG